MCALLEPMRVFAAGWAYRGRRGESLEGMIIHGVCRWVGLRCGSGTSWEGVGCVWGGIVYGVL